MKKIILIFCSLILCLTLISCNTSKDEQMPEETVKPLDNKLEEIYDKCGVKFEPNRSDLPTYEQLTQIKTGMTYEEVYALVGHPQNWNSGYWVINPQLSSGVADNAVYFIYESSDGKSIDVLYSGPNESYTMHILDFRIES